MSILQILIIAWKAAELQLSFFIKFQDFTFI